MKKHFSYRRIYSGVLYSVLAVCMLAVVGVSVYTLTYDYGSLTNISLPEISYPSFGNDVSSPGIIDKPVGKDESGIPAETSDPDPEQVYVNPCSGNILKNYTLTALLYSETMNDYRTHSGVDISGELYSPVYAYTDGTVVDIYDDPFMGTTVVVEHD
ncbi:MAG TPA: M23 family metallopeptidase, partial [Bacillota bacterium]|nr:M23 family metallopeptidase [Bacillota bacterium]